MGIEESLTPKEQFMTLIRKVLIDIEESCEAHIEAGIVAKTPTEQITIAVGVIAASAIYTAAAMELKKAQELSN